MKDSTITDVVAEPIKNLTGPLSVSVGETLRDIWDLVFGGFGAYVEKKRLTRLKDLEDFKNSLENKISSIPEKHLCEPPLSIVGPALEASKFYFEEPMIREMFAKLIASSMNNQKSSSVHPSFVEIIKQMSPLDAQNLQYFNPSLPVAEYRLSFVDDQFEVLLSNVFLSNPDVEDLPLQSQSISSLERLGLISVSYLQWLTDMSWYVGFERTNFYHKLLKSYPSDVNQTLTIQNGAASLTPLGKQFIKICLD